MSLAAARDEIARVSKKGVQRTAIYLRNGCYISVAVVDDRTVAKEYLAIVKSLRPVAYNTSFVNWWRNPRQRDGFVECQSRS